MAAKGTRRNIHITVPAADDAVNAWLNAQDNLSASIRLLIAQQAAEAGIADMFDMIVANPPKRRGRPPAPFVPAWAEEVEPETAPVVEAVKVEPKVKPVEAPKSVPAAETHVEVAGTDDALDALPALGAMGARRGGSADRGDALKAMLDS